MSLSIADLHALARAVGFPDPALAAAVAMAESRGNPNAVGDAGSSFGLWQIHVPDHPEYGAANLFDPVTNAMAAYAISRRGTYWHPWSTFNSGAYLRFYAPVAAGSALVALGALALALIAVRAQARGRRAIRR